MKELFELSLAFRGISDDAEAEEDATFLAGDDELEDDEDDDEKLVEGGAGDDAVEPGEEI